MYLEQYIRESQIKYPNISRHPLNVIKHLFYVNGNGVEIKNGNFVVNVSFNIHVPFKDYYKEELTFDEMKEYYDDYYSDKEVSELYKMRIDMNNRLKDILNSKDLAENSKEKISTMVKTDDQVWEECYEEYDDLFKRMTTIDQLPIVNFKIAEKVKEMYYKLEYLPHLHLSSGYFKMDFFNENTDRDLLEIAVGVSQGTVDFMKEVLSNPDHKLYPKSAIMGRDEEKTFKENIAMYEKDIKMLESKIEYLSKILVDLDLKTK